MTRHEVFWRRIWLYDNGQWQQVAIKDDYWLAK
jgi:hypothetical protein